MAILVTGAKGLVGSRIAKLFAARPGETVLAVARGAQGAAGANVRHVDLDLTDEASLFALVVKEKPSAIVHCAAMTNVDACERDPVGAWAINVGATAAIARGAREVGARLVALSTDYVFDGVEGNYDEEARPNPKGMYARTKRAGEEAALVLAPNTVVARVATIFSGLKTDKRTYAFDLAEKLTAGTPYKAFSDQIVSPTHADNAAAMCAALVDHTYTGVLHCAGRNALSRVAFAEKMADLLGASKSAIVPVAMADVSLPAPRPARSGLNVDRAAALLGKEIGPWSLEAALARFVSEFRAG